MIGVGRQRRLKGSARVGAMGSKAVNGLFGTLFPPAR